MTKNVEKIYNATYQYLMIFDRLQETKIVVTVG